MRFWEISRQVGGFKPTSHGTNTVRSTRPVVSNIFFVHPEIWGNDPIWLFDLYFSDGLKAPIYHSLTTLAGSLPGEFDLHARGKETLHLSQTLLGSDRKVKEFPQMVVKSFQESIPKMPLDLDLGVAVFCREYVRWVVFFCWQRKICCDEKQHYNLEFSCVVFLATAFGVFFQEPLTKWWLGGGFKYVLCSSLLGEDSQFD